MDYNKLITASELASYLRTTPAHIYNQLSKGNEGVTLPKSIKIGRRRLWLASDVSAWLDELKTRQHEQELECQLKSTSQTLKPSIRRL